MKLKVFTDVSRCKECGFCVFHCPKKCIALDGPINKGGYNTPIVDHEACIRCGICYNVCPDYVFEILEDK